MATTLIASGQERPFMTRWYEVDANGQTAVEIETNLRIVKAALCSWGEEPGNPTYQVYIYSISGSTVSIKCTHTAETAKVYVKVIGTI